MVLFFLCRLIQLQIAFCLSRNKRNIVHLHYADFQAIPSIANTGVVALFSGNYLDVRLVSSNPFSHIWFVVPGSGGE